MKFNRNLKLIPFESRAELADIAWRSRRDMDQFLLKQLPKDRDLLTARRALGRFVKRLGVDVK